MRETLEAGTRAVCQADELISEAVRRLEADARVGEGVNWRHVYQLDAPHDRDRAINVLGKHGGIVVRVGIYFENYLHEFAASEESARVFWAAYDKHQERLRTRTLDAYIVSLTPAPRPPFRLWPFGKSRKSAPIKPSEKEG